jgi:hypothetical protein
MSTRSSPSGFGRFSLVPETIPRGSYSGNKRFARAIIS